MFKKLKSFKEKQYDLLTERLVPYLKYQQYFYVVEMKNGDNYLSEEKLSYGQFAFYYEKQLVKLAPKEVHVYPEHVDLAPVFEKEEKEEEAKEEKPFFGSSLVENELDLQEEV